MTGTEDSAPMSEKESDDKSSHSKVRSGMPTTTIAVNQDVLAAKKQRAQEQRQLFTTQGTFVINLVS